MLKSKFTISLISIVRNLSKNIETTSLKNAIIAIENSDKELDEHPNIMHLKLYLSDMNDINSSRFLTLHFQKLKQLVLSSCRLINSIDLPNHHLDYIEFNPYQNFDFDNIVNGRFAWDSTPYFQLTISGRTQYYNSPSSTLEMENEEIADYKGNRSLQEVMRASQKDYSLEYFHFMCKHGNSVF